MIVPRRVTSNCLCCGRIVEDVKIGSYFGHCGRGRCVYNFTELHMNGFRNSVIVVFAPERIYFFQTEDAAKVFKRLRYPNSTALCMSMPRWYRMRPAERLKFLRENIEVVT